MKTKNKFKRVENNYIYSVVDIELIVDQNCPDRGVYTRLLSEYRLAYTDDDSLNKFIAIIKKDPIKYYRKHFGFNAPIVSKVVINPVSSCNYSFGKVSTRKGYFVLGEYSNLSIHDLCRHNRHLVQYQPNINSL